MTNLTKDLPMQILLLELSGYKRLMLNNINYIRITPTTQLQLILGTNGSGKSSILKELSPLPATPTDYNKDGYKLIEIEHNELIYVLKSTMDPSPKHSFKRDGVELNPSHTGQVQKELVKQIFNITPDINDLLVGDIAFHAMGPGERRSWFQRLSEVDYTYAVKVYQRLKESQRDVSGAIKLNNARLIQESNKLLTEPQITALKLDVMELNKFLDYLFTIKSNTYTDANDIKSVINNNTLKLKELSDTIFKLRRVFKNQYGFTSIADIDKAIIDNQTQYQIGIANAATLSSLVEADSDILHSLELAAITSTIDLDNQISVINNKILDLTNQLMVDIATTAPISAKMSLDAVMDSLTTIFSNLSPNPDKLFSRANLQTLNTNLETLNTSLNSAEAYRNKLLLQKTSQEHYKTHDALTCPSCNHSWNIGYNADTYLSICKELDVAAKAIDNILLKIDKCKADIDALLEYMRVYKSFLDLVKAWPILKPLWDHLLDHADLFNSPTSLMFILHRYKGDLEILIKIDQFNTDLVSLNKLKLSTTQAGHVTKIDIKNRLEDNQLALYNLNSENTIIKQTIATLRTYHQTAIDISQISNQLVSILTDNDLKCTELISELRNNALSDIIRTVQLSKINKEKTLAEISIQAALTESIRLDLVNLEQRSVALKICVSALSPTDGLIAKGMMGFINIFIKQMNLFIKKIWLYPLTILHCNIEDGADIDLDYKFPISINDNAPIPDVSKGSSAMREVIDLAFRLTAMGYLGLKEYPVILDELGKTFDTAHRVQAFKTILDLLISSSHSQLFIVNHYNAMYSSLTNTEIMVLCDANIILPQDCIYNQHVKIN